MNETFNVIVYGTLRKDERNGALLSEATCLADSTGRMEFFMTQDSVFQ
ncbi:hypothetical protein LGQ02_09760 [Bacillus shivajii]|nr:hypothetical protein [Bacillus shivajii]UCZ54980.1 hypothetical protein LGQ02_09760 [Bacillus shivajii]